MKELSIEEKAKAYDEAIEKAKSWYVDAQIGFKKSLETLFPELKENEDEKIRKAIIECVKNYGPSSANPKLFKNMLAWLEKQGKKDSQVTSPTFTFDDVLALQCCMETVKKVQEDKELYEQLQSLHNRIHDVYWLEKQSEKKPTDKIEPKFKVGDWVVFKNKHQSIYQVEKIEDGYYILRHTHGGTFRVCVLHDESLRLWTIQDAKPGDVLVNWNNTIYLFKGIDDGEVVKFYCFYNTNYEEFKTPFDDDSHLGLTEPQFEHHPAIKEQRELLFTKMKDAGYEFDFEKKELKKIEQNNTEEYIETKGLSELEAEAEELTKEISDEIEADKVVIKQGEHNSAWSEEDTETLNGIVNYLFTSTDVSSIEGSDKWYDWLKSLKNRVIPKQEWSEEDENMLRRVFDSLNTYAKNAYPILKSIVEEEIDWLKSIKERTKGE